ncbi:site-specific integrase, partial [Paramagnetospirillum marisnigri]|uniref:site-specific integrase n=1 Tax=Paramagnetospirillum marisnigri TaxID=1285242 RepID=UPI0012E82A18
LRRPWPGNINHASLTFDLEPPLGAGQDAWDRRRLRRFAHYAAGQGWRPEDITSDHMLRYFSVLKHEAINGYEWEAYGRVCKTWNRLVDTVPGWPGKAVTVVRKRTPYMVKLEDLAQGLRAELVGYLDFLAGDGAADHGDGPLFLKDMPRKALSPVTVKLRQTQMLQYISALVAKGYPLDSLATVDAITSTRAISDAFDFFVERAGGKVPTQVQFIAIAMRGLLYHRLTGGLRRRVRHDRDSPPPSLVTDARLDLLEQIIKQSAPTERGLRAKNKRCLAQFDHRNLGKLLHLPATLLKEAKTTGGKDGARLAEAALAIEMLLMCPIRVGNLVSLDLVRHFIKSSPGPKGTIHLSIPKDEVKNRRAIEFELPPHLARMLDRHVRDFRPLVPGCGSTWLFPSTDGGPRSYKLMSRHIAGIIRTRAGLIMTSHQFRHLAGKMFLEDTPAGHETVREVLGHASIDTTTENYTGIDQVKAGRTYDRSVLKLRDQTKFITSKRRKK